LNSFQGFKKEIPCVATLEFRASTGSNVGSSIITHSQYNWMVLKSWLQNNFLEYYKKWLKMLNVQCKWFWFAWKSVPMGTYMYKEKKMAPEFTMKKEQTTVLCPVAMLKKIFTWSELSFTCREFVSLMVFLKFLLPV